MSSPPSATTKQTLSKEDIEALIARRLQEKEKELLTKLGGAREPSDYREKRRALALAEVKEAGVGDWFRPMTKWAKHDKKIMMWIFHTIRTHQLTIDNADRLLRKRDTPWLKIAVVLGIFGLLFAIVLNQTESLGLGAWLQNNGYIVVSVAVVVVAILLVMRNRGKRQEQMQAP